eukprot:TRINITY_DN7071_c1_g1_i1.p1 TRINITY_DN7071_c1_g1~~TRINITY_DN7071_c1_g1_i1.p1  ORF type:complete len:338 (+),score=109.15 TRINITY_DN7071_c1_g1_i1:57-1070(+)
MHLAPGQLSELALACSEVPSMQTSACTPSDASMDHSSQGEQSDAGTQWCNFLYTARCPFCTPGASPNQCAFMHIDSYATLPEDQRRAAGVPNFMPVHLRSLQTEIRRAVNDRAQAVLDAWQVVCKWGGAGATASVNPYHDAVKVLRELGWCLPEREHTTAGHVAELCDAPHAEDVEEILSLCVRSMRYDIPGTSEVVLRTISWALSLEKPAVELRGSLMLQGSLNDECPSECSEMPSLLDTVSHIGEPAAMTRRQERRAAYVQKQKAKKQQVKMAKQQLRQQQEAAKQVQQLQAPVVGVPTQVDHWVAAQQYAALVCAQQQQQQQQLMLQGLTPNAP